MNFEHRSGKINPIQLTKYSYIAQEKKQSQKSSEPNYIINRQIQEPANTLPKNKANLLVKILIIKPKTDDTKL